MNEVSNFILEYDVICLQETWLKQKAITEFGEYEVLRSDRPFEMGGGTAIICRSSLDPFVFKLQFLESELFEYSSCIINKIKIHNKPVLILSIYRSPSITIGAKKWENLIRNLE